MNKGQSISSELLRKSAADQNLNNENTVKLKPNPNANFISEFVSYKVGTAERYQQDQILYDCKYGSIKYKNASLKLAAAREKSLQAEINMRFLVSNQKPDLLIDFLDLIKSLEECIAFKNRGLVKLSKFKEGSASWKLQYKENEEYDLLAVNKEAEIMRLLGYISKDEDKIDL